MNRRPVLSIDKENEIEKRRREIARQKEARERQIKGEVREMNHAKSPTLSFGLGGDFREKTTGIP